MSELALNCRGGGCHGDEAFGDIFVIHVAGTTLDTATLASLQDAVLHLLKVLTPISHELCSAAKAAQLPMETLVKEMLTQLQEETSPIKMGLGKFRLVNVRRHLQRRAPLCVLRFLC